MRRIRIGLGLLLLGCFALPGVAGAKGPSPAKRASRLFDKQLGLVVGRAVTIARDLKNQTGIARIKLMNGYVYQAKVDLASNRLLSAKPLTGRANQLTALAAGRKGWKAGYVIENDPMSMVPAMTARGNPRRFVVDYDRGLETSVVVPFNKAGVAGRVRIGPPPAQ